MTKAELVNEIAIQTGYDKRTITKVVESAMQNVKKAIAGGDSVFLRSFGTFGTKVRAEKVARNISKHTSVIVPAHNVVVFKPAPEFSATVRK